MRKLTKRPPGELTWADINGDHGQNSRESIFRGLGDAVALTLTMSVILALAVVGAVSLVP